MSNRVGVRRQSAAATAPWIQFKLWEKHPVLRSKAASLLPHSKIDLEARPGTKDISGRRATPATSHTNCCTGPKQVPHPIALSGPRDWLFDRRVNRRPD